MRVMIAPPRRRRFVPSPAVFQRAILRWYAANRRDLPWRRTRDPWKILISEVMLQQTQVERVIPKYVAFLRAWPTPEVMAKSPLAAVLRAWSGLGYNRRAANLRAAAIAVAGAGGRMPRDVDGLDALPGVGTYTARAVAAFAHNDDVALWDTNVRRIALRVFFGGEFAADPGAAALEGALERALPKGKSRDWYNALMDFGSAVCTGRVPRCVTCPLRHSCAAAPRFLSGEVPARGLVRPQTKFDGSRRQARGAALRALAAAGSHGLSGAELRQAIRRDDADSIVDTLIREGLAARRRGRVALP
jgi:A/G-specific adenine glycosylase